MVDFVSARDSINENKNGTTNNKEFFDVYKMYRVLYIIFL